VNVASLARDAGVARTTVAGYLDILEDTLLTYRLRAYEGRWRVRERRHPKLYWVDPGLARAVKQQLGRVAVEERGALLEGWVLTLLRTYTETSAVFDGLYYRASANVEVDFLLERAGAHLALEVKSAPRIGSAHLAGLRAIAELASITRRILIHPGTLERKTDDGIEIWPISTFVHRLATGRVVALRCSAERLIAKGRRTPRGRRKYRRGG
jgi:predicted AAA+ superfamily ATPase